MTKGGEQNPFFKRWGAVLRFIFKSRSFNLVIKYLNWILFRIDIVLTWIGARPVEDPNIIIGQITTILYFLIFAIWLI